MNAPFDLAERDRRWARVREGMASRGIDLLIALPFAVPADVFYLGCEMGAVLFPADDEPWIVLGGEDSHLAVEREGWIARRSSATPSGASRVEYGTAVAETVTRLGLRPRRVGVVGLDGSPYTNVRLPEGYVPYTTVARILASLGEAEVVDGTPVLAEARSVRSEAEIDAFRRAVVVAEGASSAIADAFRVGALLADAYRAGMAALMQPGVNEFNLAFAPGRWGEPRPRLMAPSPGRIEEGQFVAAEIYPGVKGYVAQVAQPFAASALTVEQQEAFDLNVAAFEAARTAMRPGATWRDVRAAATAVAEGTQWTVTFVLHAGPDGPLFVPNHDNEEMLDVPLQASTVYVCKPHVFPTAAGRYVARSHDVAWGDTVVVREGGAERLGTRPAVVLP